MSELDRIRVCVAQVSYVPNALSWSGRHWLPYEPLARPGKAEAIDQGNSLAEIFGEAVSDPNTMLTHVERIAGDAATQKILTILQIAEKEEIDLIVFPEMIAPVAAIPAISGFSTDRLIVVGIGYIKSRAVAQDLIDLGCDGPVEDLVGRNLAVAVHNGKITSATKKHAAHEEPLTPGHGFSLLEPTFRGRKYRVAIAICKDFLRQQEELRQASPDIVCVPALTRNSAPFTPDAPRDWVLLFANSSRYGGSFISMSGLNGPEFVTRGLTSPLPPGADSLMAADYEGPQTVPTPLRASTGMLKLRSQLIESSQVENAEIQAAGALEELRELPGKVGQQILPDISRWLVHIPEQCVLSQSLVRLRKSLVQELEDDELIRLLSTHFQVPSALGEEDIRRKQARYAVQRIGYLVSLSHDIQDAGRRLDVYRALGGQSSPRATNVDAGWTFSLRLGKYDSDSATRSLPRQLNLLKAIGDLDLAGLSLTYRLQAKPSPVRDDSTAFFDVIATCTDHSLDAQTVEAQLRSIFVSSWSVSSSTELEKPENMTSFVRVKLKGAGRMGGLRDDWSSVVDLLRTHAGPVAVDMQIRRSPAKKRSQPVRESEGDILQNFVRFPYVAMMNDQSERFAAAFQSLRSEEDSTDRSIVFSILISSKDQLSPLLLRNVVREILGNQEYDLEDVDEFEHSPGSEPYSAAEILRLFHPPYGAIQGRGVPVDRSTPVFYRSDRFPAAGVALGTAKVAGPVSDHEVEVRLDDEMRRRHLYVIGKTGTGKTNLLKQIAKQDIDEGRGICVIDPHGDLVDYLVDHCGQRINDVLLLDFGNTREICTFNPLLVDCGNKDRQGLHVSDLLAVLNAQFYNQWSGPRFNDLARLAFDTMLDPKFPVPPAMTLVEELYQNHELMSDIISTFKGSRIGRRWEALADIRLSEQAELFSWALSKFADLMPEHGLLRAQLGGNEANYSIEDVVASRGVLLIKIPDSRLGTQGSAFLASLLLKRIQRAVFASTAVVPAEAGREHPLTLMIDEFQRVATAGLEPFIAEARKFNCGLVLAHQNLEQLAAFSTFEGMRSRELVEVILGNVGSAVSFRVGPLDVGRVSDLLNTSHSSLAGLSGFDALCRTLVDGNETLGFTLKVPDSRLDVGDPTVSAAVLDRMRRERICVPCEELAEKADSAPRRLRRGLSPLPPKVQDDLDFAKEAIRNASPEALAAAGAGVFDVLFEELARLCLKGSDKSVRAMTSALELDDAGLLDGAPSLAEVRLEVGRLADEFGFDGASNEAERFARLLLLAVEFILANRLEGSAGVFDLLREVLGAQRVATSDLVGALSAEDTEQRLFELGLDVDETGFVTRVVGRLRSVSASVLGGDAVSES